MRHLFQNERTDPGPIFEMMEELAADGTSSALEVFPAASGFRWKASIADTYANYGETPQEAWRNACDAWERRDQEKCIGDVRYITMAELKASGQFSDEALGKIEPGKVILAEPPSAPEVTTSFTSGGYSWVDENGMTRFRPFTP